MQDQKRTARRFGDGFHFLMSLTSTPHLTGAVAPSGRALARAMAEASGPPPDGLVVELGPGTGPVTQALIDRGVAPRRLVMLEFNPQFCRLLRERFPGARVIEGDAYDLPRSLAELGGARVSAFVSSLPLLTRPPGDREKLLGDAFALMGREGAFVQFTYGLVSPIPRELLGDRYSARRGRPIWANLPPARVWTYRLEAQPRPQGEGRRRRGAGA
ncbi:phosphatidylethanolamine/phosphatidyl-N-methylethanolamine N-methyltransferase [Roseiarcus fermentans]|uniref:Phosphatidylethanolamine/phosphatidyl-N-methylethanolamine N-methyltransferase n=1 Tax=Roseiarcus fermentans TaxID=1473586 RepID=A0A366FRP8_9HYPH|nr:phospholipid methyltransferase [Roseiarcus fermentans]RBP17237.1 phosphatidylethanolamine/phosphatidyl-N-methylethanolamine N-methyltransferase [Roseiarcus fermentans]